MAQPALQQPAQDSYPSSLQRPQSSHQSVVQHGIQMAFKPVQAQAGHVSQIGSKLYSCQEYVSHPNYQLAGTYVYVVSPSRPPGPLQSTLLSTFRPAQLPEQPSYHYQPQMLPSHQSLSQSVQSSSHPQMLPGHQSLSSYETLSQPRFQTSMPGQSSYQSVSRSCSQSLEQASSLSNSESVQPGIQYPAQLNYQAVTNQNAPGPAQSNQRMSQTNFRLLKQVMSWLFIFVCRFLVLACLL
uniref:Uncharacterized protein n=1 Tax=Cyprinus carpio TaxID=7962 RepID=A0A8C2JJQ0_CYPCA